MPSIFVTLIGGSPWGFRIQGGSGTGLPLRLSRVNPGSKAAQQGLLEGDVLKMVNGYLTDGLTQADVRDIIRDSGHTLTLEIEREPIANGTEEKLYTATKTLVVNSPVKSGVASHMNSLPNDQRPMSPKQAKDALSSYENSNHAFLQNRNGENLNRNCSPPFHTSSPRSYQNHSYQNNSQMLSSETSHDNNENHLVNNASDSNYIARKNFVNGNTKPNMYQSTVITNVPPPAGAVLIDQKVSVEGDNVHTDKYYAVPVKEILKEKTSTTKFIPAPPKYEGIGPTEEGIPTGLRQSVKKENMSNWYKTMYKTLHKVDNSDDTYVIGYTSEPEIGREDKHNRTKSATLDSRLKAKNYPPSAKSSIEIYNVHPRRIEDYEPGHSSIADKEVNTGSKRFLPSLNHPKPLYEFKDGYESETAVTKKDIQPVEMNIEQQKFWYREVQKGGDVPQFGLGKPAPEKPKEPVIGPPPPPPLNYPKLPQYQQACRPQTLPPETSNQFDDFFKNDENSYAHQMRHAINVELQQRLYPGSQVSPNSRMAKTPPLSKSPEMRTPARILYNFVAESPRELSLKKDDIVLIYKQLDKNWYEGEHKGKIGIFPVSYVEILPPEHVTARKLKEGFAKTLYDFKAHTAVELEAKKGEEIQLLRRVDENWYEGRIRDRKGIIPSSYIHVIEEPEDNGRFSRSHTPLNSSPKTTSTQSAVSPCSTNSISPRSISNGTSNYVQNGTCRQVKKGSYMIEPTLYRTLYSYSPHNADELELQEGDNVYVVEMCDDGWYVGTSVRTGVLGIFPGNYVEKVI